MAAAAAARVTTTIKVVLLPFRALLCKDIVVTAKESRMIHIAHLLEWLRDPTTDSASF